jgi:hypothetical protein
METRRYPRLNAELRRQLARVASADGVAFPCSVKLKNGTLMERVYLAAAADWIVQWGVWPEDDPGKRSIDIQDVVSINDSRSRLPARFAAEIDAAGESGMGYCIFTVIFNDGSRQAYATGNAVDFVDYPKGQSPATVAKVLPHVGRGDPNLRNGPEYHWCLFDSA